MKHIKLFEQFVNEYTLSEKKITLDWDDDETSIVFSDGEVAQVDYDGDFKYRGEWFSTADHTSGDDLIKDLQKRFKKDRFVWVSESNVYEARSIEKIEKDRAKIINDMSEVVTNWKAAKQSGDKKAEISFLQRLKDLTAKKKDLDKEINQAVAGKDRFIELVISEHNTIYESVMSEIDILAKGAKNFKDFVKEFKKEFGEIGNEKELNAWLKSIYDSTQNESVNEGEMADQTIFDLWEEVYGEKFIHEYPKMFKVLKSRPKVDRKEFARIWDEIYGENFEKEYPAMWDKMEK